MELWTEKGLWTQPSDEQIVKLIRDLPENEYAILGTEDEVFIQTMLLEHGYLLEKRDGCADSHFEAIPTDGRERIQGSSPWWAFWEKPKAIYFFSGDEIAEAFCAYKRGTEPASIARWNQIWI